MNAYSAYNAYSNNRVMMASPAELTLMLYEGAIKFVNIAIVAINKKDYHKANTNIQKAELIIAEFRDTLDFSYPVAQDFENVYSYIAKRLLLANVRKDSAILEEVLTHLRTMRDTWKEVMEKTKNGTVVA